MRTTAISTLIPLPAPPKCIGQQQPRFIDTAVARLSKLHLRAARAQLELVGHAVALVLGFSHLRITDALERRSPKTAAKARRAYRYGYPQTPFRHRDNRHADFSLVVYCLLGAIAGVLAGLRRGRGIVTVPMFVFASGWQNSSRWTYSMCSWVPDADGRRSMFISISLLAGPQPQQGQPSGCRTEHHPGILIGTACGSFLASHVPRLQFFVALS